MKIAVFPGSFDPVTNGHLDLVRRASQIFDRLVVLVGYNLSKHYLFSLSKRVKLIRENLVDLSNVKVTSANELTTDFMKKIGARVIVRGIRNYQDLVYEKSIMAINHRLDPEIQTIFLLSRPKYEVISSRILKEVNHFGGDVSAYVPENVNECLKRVQR